MTAREFLEQLTTGALSEPFDLAGLVSLDSDNPEVIIFSPGLSSEQWFPIPVDSLDHGHLLGHNRLEDQEHPHVQLFFKETDDPTMILLRQLLKQCEEKLQTCSTRKSSLPAGITPALDNQNTTPAPGNDLSSDGAIPSYAVRTILQTTDVAYRDYCFTGAYTCLQYPGTSTYLCYICCNGVWYPTTNYDRCGASLTLTCNGIEYSTPNCGGGLIV